MAKVSVLYHHFPHYRAPVMRALTRSTENEYSFFGGVESFQGIKAFEGDDVVKINPVTFTSCEKTGKLDFSDFERAVSAEFDVVIIIGNPNIRGSWSAVRKAKKNGLKTAFWTHGWLKKEMWLKEKVRNFYYNQADLVLTYGARAKKLGVASGFDEKRIRTIWNSLDWDLQTVYFDNFRMDDRSTLRSRLGMPTNKPVILTISRVTDICRYDWLVEAVAVLRDKWGVLAEVWMIGEGPALASLKELAKKKQVQLHTAGAIFEEELISQYVMAADVVASPGKVGLTAMHALAYGTPVITHNDLDSQMPEVEAITEGVSGAFFEFGSIAGLAEALLAVVDAKQDVFEVRVGCRRSLEGRFTPKDQARLVDATIAELVES